MKFQSILPPIKSSTNIIVWPVVFTSSTELKQLKANSEVEEMFLCPWTKLTKNNNKPFTFSFRERDLESDLYLVDKYTIWGLTAKIITSLDFS